jgi:hypothetical protein
MGETMSTALAVDDDPVSRSLPDVVVTDLTMPSWVADQRRKAASYSGK